MYPCIKYVFSTTGFVGGTYYNDEGGASNHMCLRPDPIFRPTDEARSTRSEVHGAEYHHPPKSQLHDHEVPCAVCQVTRRSMLMMPGTNLCDEGWTTEYVGYISSEKGGNANHHRSEFICVDDDAEPTPNSSPDDDDGILLIPAQTICGSLPCLPYVDSKDLLCVVCSR